MIVVREIDAVWFGISAERVLCIDDPEPHPLGAHEMGLHTQCHVDPRSTRRTLAGLIPDLTGLTPNAMGCQVAIRVTTEPAGGGKKARVVDMLAVLVP